MRRAAVIVMASTALVAAAFAWWRRHPRAGSAWVNRVVDPWLVRQGIIDRSDGQLGLIEHIGRTSGIVRRSPVHPVPTEAGFRIVVPLGTASQWAANVVAAGRCRLEVDGMVHELDEPTLVLASDVDLIPPVAARLLDRLGFRYLLLHRVAAESGTLAQAEPGPEAEVVEPVLAATA